MIKMLWKLNFSTEEVRMEIYQPPLPEEITMEDVQWFVINKNNWDESVVKIEEIS